MYGRRFVGYGCVQRELKASVQQSCLCGMFREESHGYVAVKRKCHPNCFAILSPSFVCSLKDLRHGWSGAGL